MQFGIFTVGDVTVDPTTGRAPSEHERIKAMLAIAQKAEERSVWTSSRPVSTTTRRSCRRRRPRCSATSRRAPSV
ncbi:hypothetical protein [Streptomyces sp. KL116D]|uniref:hypothetical protein n=1 Tax=Streptomyces sp. KL116D TaxID=3045152 RepID=UPI0035592A50